MELWIGALNLGLLYSFMTMGVFITFRIHDFPDITVDGSLTTGAAVCAVALVAGANPFTALLAAFCAGMVAGSATAFIHTRFDVNGLLAGILVMTGLYSINLHIMGRSNIPLLQQTTFFSLLKGFNPGLNPEVWTCMALMATAALFWLGVSLFFKTDLGIVMRATGNNADMAAAAGVNVARVKMFGVAVANGLVALSGGLVAQYQGFADIGMGIGTVVTGLAAVIIGESVLKMTSIYVQTLRVIAGSVIFRMMIAVALFIGMNPIDLKLLTALFVLITLIASRMTGSSERSGTFQLRSLTALVSRRPLASALILLLLVFAGAAALGLKHFRSAPTTQAKIFKIGVVQVEDNGLMNVTRDSFVKEMEDLGYRNGRNCAIDLQNANGDLPTVNSILDMFLQQGFDIIVSLSTNCTQAAISKVKDRPVVFATVANPFIIHAGASETDHLPNVTGVYGASPMDRLLAMVRQFKPGRITIGTIWDPAFANSVFNYGLLQKAVEAERDVTLVGASISNSSDVYQAALSLTQKNVDAFVLVTDNIVYAAFDSVVKAAQSKKIPIFLSDVERLGDGALGVLGYDYTSSGIQAARLTDRILKGENPRNIPFEQYTKLTLGVNQKAARELGLTIPPEILSKATVVIREDQ